ncbi:MAG: universal stress protein [Deltaproteobacteria bacterium]|nr:universal stress protein [Deltaproteobacteria bacterium]
MSYDVKRILVPVDFSLCSWSALQHAAALARKLAAEVDILHILETPHYIVPEVMVFPPGEAPQTLAEYTRTQVSKEMDRFLQDAPNVGDVPIRVLIERGDPLRKIIELAENNGYDLIVMGTHGRRGLTHLLLGSVAERVVQRSRCPVLTVHPPQTDGGTPEV